MAGLGEHFFVWFDNLELKVVGPTKKLSETRGKLCASSLKTGEHFAHKKSDDVAGVLSEVKKLMKSSLESMPLRNCVDAVRSSAKCEWTIYDNSARLLCNETPHFKRIKNEAALRYVLGDPIMEMMCDSGGLKVC